MKSQKLKNIEEIIKDRKKGKHVYLDNRLIMGGTSNIDEITVDYGAFFEYYEKNKEKTKQV